ncbi:MAG TPA: RHS repeat-associated core domain-containing protein, partial [Terriglobales bacterium]|nr:RHS repeat-associated core domain-containing protein [Terriglobales bacterium]
ITYPDQTSVSFTYDSRGRRTSATDQNGKNTTYAYDGADRLIAVTDAAQNTTQYAYDTENNLLSITDANGHATSFSYDAFGRVTQTAFPSSYVEAYAYDAVGNLVSKTDRKGQAIQYVYDALNRLTHKGYPDSTGVDYVYDLVGKIRQVTDPTGTYGFAYDNMGRLIGTTTQYSFLPGKTFANGYGYDAASNRTSFTAPDGSTTAYNYDTLNRLGTLNSSLAGQFTFGYDALSRRTQLARPNGVTTTYQYDNLSRLLSVTHQAGGATIDGAGYAYDNAGNRIGKGNFLDGSLEQYTYDAIYQLTQVTRNNAITEAYTYDNVGNRLTSLTVPSLSYNSSNELVSTSRSSYTYDYNGNLTSKANSSGTTGFTWDYENRFTSVTLPNGGGTVTFKYDPFGRRIQKSGPAGTTNYLYDGANTVTDLDANGAVLARYAQGTGIDEPLASSTGLGTAFFEADGLGSITSLSGTSGITDTYTYKPFGITTATGNNPNRFRFTAREWDQETGLYYYRARYYDPTIGRFIGSDPSGFSSGTNPYNYVGGSPLGRIDPLGLDWLEYTGQTLTVWPGKYKDRGHAPLLQCRASSGLPGHQSPSEQNSPDTGPVHEGHYWINLALDPHRWAGFYQPTNELAAAYGVQRIRPEYTLSDGRIGYPTGWGTWRARLEPRDASTARHNFYLHNSTKGYTHGCIETCDTLYDRFVKYHDQGLRGIDVMVDYTTNSTNGGTLVP